MTISVVIPAYNEERYIATCLEMVMAEVRRFAKQRPDVGVEVVVVNNASTDRTAALAVGFEGVRVINEPRKGLVRARAAGFAMTKGELVANVDADTRMPLGWLSRVIYEFERDPRLVALSGPYHYHDADAFTRSLTQIFYFAGHLISLLNQYVLRSGAMLQGGNFIIHRDAWERAGGFDTSIEFYGEDTDVARRIAKFGRIKWTWALPMGTTARRLKREGVAKTGFVYALNFFSVTFFGRPATASYHDIRPE